MNEVARIGKAKLEEFEIVALRGIEAQQWKLQRQIEEAMQKLEESRAVVYSVIEARLGLPDGSIINGTAKIEAETIVWEDSKE